MALVPCPECHQEVSDRAVSCPQCGYPIASLLSSLSVDRSDTQLVRGETGVAIEDSGLPEFYRQRFEAFDSFEGRRTAFWNWAAFLLGPIWYLAKGMWLKPLVYFVVAIVAAAIEPAFLFLVPTVFGIYAGQFGTFDYYRFHRHGEQM